MSEGPMDPEEAAKATGVNVPGDTPRQRIPPPGKKFVLQCAVLFMLKHAGGNSRSGVMGTMLFGKDLSDRAILDVFTKAINGGCECGAAECMPAAGLAEGLLRMTLTQRKFVQKHTIARLKAEGLFGGR